MKKIVYTNPPTIEFLYKREINYVAKIIFENDYHTIPITIKVSTSAKEIKINMDTKHPNIFTAIKLINTSAVIVPKKYIHHPPSRSVTYIHRLHGRLRSY